MKVIHQHNQGSVIARKNGIKEISKDSVYFCFCDADDLLPKDSIEKLYKAIVKDDSDICTGFTCRLFRSLKIPQCFVPNVFKQEYQIYNQKSFINELYCSWFGISNVPVNLFAKLYKTEMFKSIMLEVPNVVHFFGEDLIQTLNRFPKAKKSAYINDVVYYYRVGGGTSKFQPLMIEDWISLYNYKKDFSEKYPMPQDIEYLMNIELCNMVFTYFEMLVKFKKNDIHYLRNQVEKTCRREEVMKASVFCFERNRNNYKAEHIQNIAIDEIINSLISYQKISVKVLIKRILFLFN